MTDDDIKAPADEPLCSSCGYPLKEYTAGLRHFGTHTAHVEWYCVQRLKAEVERLRAERDALARDAARFRWLAAHCRSTAEHWGGRWSIVVEGPAPTRHDDEDAFDVAIDAAMGAGNE